MDEELRGMWTDLEAAFHGERAAGVDARIQIELDGGETYYLDIHDQRVAAHQGRAMGPRLTLQASETDLISIFNGKLDHTSAFFQGRLRVRGDMNLAMKVMALFK